MAVEPQQQRFDFVPTHLVVKAMRDSGYKNAAYAIAELMDNSIQAGATSVELLCSELEVQLETRRRRRLDQIAVLDNGSGMDEDTLRMALQFGNGKYLDSTEGMGKFGMGLPNSSVSQCTKVDVWSWTAGPKSAIHTHLDVQEILDGRTEVPRPEAQAIPDLWMAAGTSFEKGGTLVVWSHLDRIMWRTALSVINNSEFLVGRMYRRFLDGGEVAIRMVSFLREDPKGAKEIDKLAEANDPMYLMAPTSTPEPYDDKPMFQHYGGDSWEVPFEISVDGESHEVIVRFSVATEEARGGAGDPGRRPYGRHAARNIGVSLIRADRELDLDATLTIPYDPRERWWGVEVEFPPALDELFGVTNNKQSARNFTDAARLDLTSLAAGDKSITQLKAELAEEGDPLAPLIEIVHRIATTLSAIRKLLHVQTRGTRGRRRYDDAAESQATTATRKRQQEGHAGRSDQEEGLEDDERQKAIEDELTEEGVPKKEAQQKAYETVSRGLKYVFNVAELESPAFFSVKPRAGTIFVVLNATHPAYKHLIEVLEDVDDEQDREPASDSLTERLRNANIGLKLVLSAWARYEDEQPSDRLREQCQDIRTDWGRVARQFLERDE